MQMRSLLTRLGLERDAEAARDQGLQSAELDWDSDIAPFLLYHGSASVDVAAFTNAASAVLR